MTLCQHDDKSTLRKDNVTVKTCFHNCRTGVMLVVHNCGTCPRTCPKFDRPRTSSRTCSGTCCGVCCTGTYSGTCLGSCTELTPSRTQSRKETSEETRHKRHSSGKPKPDHTGKRGGRQVRRQVGRRDKPAAVQQRKNKTAITQADMWGDR